MSALAAAVSAQIGAEVRTRLRSAATVVAFLFLLAGAYFWIPPPTGNAASISWRTAEGALRSSVQSAAYLGVTVAFLAGIFQLLVAFYLVAGSVRRDRESGVGAILAATPMSKTGYLLGKFAAHAAYLGLLSLLILPVGLYHFLRFGQGPFAAVPFLVPFLLVAVPAIAFVAAMTVLFDVTPGLRSRGGLVIWFFVATALMSFGAMDRSPEGRKRWPVFDPIGVSTLERRVEASVPEARPDSFSTGLIFHDQPIERVAWKGIEIDRRLVLARAAALGWAVPPFLLAVLLFDRFDPARRRPGARAEARLRRGPEPAGEAPAGETPAVRPALAALSRVAARPAALASVLAEARLVWESGSFLKWPLLACGLIAALLPAEGLKGVTAAFLVLLVPLVSEAAAREELAGTRPLVFSQPGVPRSAVLWKAAAVALFLVALGLPILVRSFLISPARGLAFATGLLFVAALAVAAGSLTGGGKLFSGLFLGIWYAAVSGVAALDFCGAFGGGLDPASRAAFLAAGAAGLAVAWLWERRRAASG